MQEGRLDPAAADFQRVLALDPEHSAAARNMRLLSEHLSARR
jgi:hypothetical protein